MTIRYGAVREDQVREDPGSFEAVLTSEATIHRAADALRRHVGGHPEHDWAGEVRSAITQRNTP